MENESRFLLDRELFEDLKAYLEDKRSALRDTLLFSISHEKGAGAPFLPDPAYQMDTFQYALSEFDKRTSNLTADQLKHMNYERIIDKFSNILWNYVEILEGMCRELFDQLQSIPVDLWDQELYDRLESAKVFLWDKLKEIDHFLNSLDASLKKFILKCLSNNPLNLLKKIRVHVHKALDPELTKRIKKAELYLHNEFNQFTKEYSFFKKVEEKIETEQYKFQGYVTLSQLDVGKQRLYRRTWRLLKMWSASKTQQKYLSLRFVHTIRYACPTGKLLLVFREYITQLKLNLFELARTFRENGSTQDISGQAIIALWRGEVYTLKMTIEKYRDFLNATDPKVNGTRSLFKWKNEESRKSKELDQLKEEAAQIDGWLVTLFDSQERGSHEDLTLETLRFKKADRILLDMGQPLVSRSVMKDKVSEYVSELKKIGELVSPLPDVSDLMRNSLLKAFKLDSKHETLTEHEDFWPVWEVHHGLSPSSPSALHTKRMKVYRKVIQHIKHWMLTNQLSMHIQDVEHEIHDIQEALQEFYHSVKNELSPYQKREFKTELLEERVFFSAFFVFLRKHDKEGKRLRGEFVFVDKYFNAIHQKLNDALHTPEQSEENLSDDEILSDEDLPEED